MRRKRQSVSFLMIILFLFASLSISNPVSAEEEIDNWPGGDAWLKIELVSWIGNETVEWDNNNGLPDPYFHICIDADENEVICFNTPTWEDTIVLSYAWNTTIDIPDASSNLTIEILCKDDDAFNDDECDLDSRWDYWKLTRDFPWTEQTSLNVIDNGSRDIDESKKGASSQWRFTIVGFGDEDGDGISDNIDICPNTEQGAALMFSGCSWLQTDIDGDGVISGLDANPFDKRIGEVKGGSRTFIRGGLADLYNTAGAGCRPGGGSTYILDQYDPRDTDPSVGAYGFDVDIMDSCQSSTIQYRDARDEDEYADSKVLDIGSSDIDLVNIHLFEPHFQMTKDGPSLVHRYHPTEFECHTKVLSLEPDGTSTELLSFRYIDGGKDYSNSRCDNVDNSWSRYIGAFGDFDGNGIPDFVHATDDFENQRFDQCTMYFGISDNPLQFSSPIVLEVDSEYVDCAGDIHSSDLDSDGFDDIISSEGIVFMDDSSDFHSEFFMFEVGRDSEYVFTTDADKDGDLDVILRTCSTGTVICKQEVFINAWFSDSDSDSVPDTDDICPGYPDSVDWDKDGTPDGCDSDDDNDGTPDVDDLCPETPIGALVDWGCPMDWDEDGVYDGLDQCPESLGYGGVDEEGCDLDSDEDGIPDFDDLCPQTPIGYEVDYMGCIVENHDFDNDGYPDDQDDFPENNQEWSDSDGDGIGDNADAFPTNPSKWSVEDGGEVDQKSDSTESKAIAGFIGVIFGIGVLGGIVTIILKLTNRKSTSLPRPSVRIQQVPVVTQYQVKPQYAVQQPVQLKHPVYVESAESKELKSQVDAQSRQIELLQRQNAQNEITSEQYRQMLDEAERQKQELEMQLEESKKNTQIVQNITYNISDSAISGDITNKIGSTDKVDNENHE